MYARILLFEWTMPSPNWALWCSCMCTWYCLSEWKMCLSNRWSLCYSEMCCWFNLCRRHLHSSNYRSLRNCKVCCRLDLCRWNLYPSDYWSLCNSQMFSRFCMQKWYLCQRYCSTLWSPKIYMHLTKTNWNNLSNSLLFCCPNIKLLWNYCWWKVNWIPWRMWCMQKHQGSILLEQTLRSNQTLLEWISLYLWLAMPNWIVLRELKMC